MPSVRARFVAAIEALGNHGLRAVPSEANFVLVLFEGELTGEAAYDGLAEARLHHPLAAGPGPAARPADHRSAPAEQMDAIAAVLRELAEAAR